MIVKPGDYVVTDKNCWTSLGLHPGVPVKVLIAGMYVDGDSENVHLEGVQGAWCMYDEDFEKYDPITPEEAARAKSLPSAEEALAFVRRMQS